MIISNFAGEFGDAPVTRGPLSGRLHYVRELGFEQRVLDRTLLGKGWSVEPTVGRKLLGATLRGGLARDTLT